MNIEFLKEIGLTDGEIKVFLALIRLGSSSTGPIVKEAKIHSSKVYPILDRLIDKGFVSFIKEGKKTIYDANPPTSILTFLDKKQTQLDQQKQEAKKVMTYLENLRSIHPETEATIFKGKKGLKEAYKRAVMDLKEGDTAYQMFLPALDEDLSAFFINLVNSNSKRRVKQFLLFNEPCIESNGIKNVKNATVKIGISPEYSSPVEICVYNDNVIIATSGVSDPITVLIKNKFIADSFKQQFNIILQQDVVVSKGINALIKAHEKTYQKLKSGEEYVYLGIPKFQPKEQHKYWLKDHKRRTNAKIKCRLLFNKDTDQKFLDERNKHSGCDARFMPTDVKTPSYMAIFKDTVMMAIPKKEPLVIEINNKEVAESFQAYFEAFWKLSKKL